MNLYSANHRVLGAIYFRATSMAQALQVARELDASTIVELSFDDSRAHLIERCIANIESVSAHARDAIERNDTDAALRIGKLLIYLKIELAELAAREFTAKRLNAA